MADEEEQPDFVFNHEFNLNEDDTITDQELLKLLEDKESKSKLNEIVEQFIECDNAEAMIFLFSNNYRISTLNDKKETPIHLALINGSHDILRIDSLFFKCEEEINYTDCYGLSHLHIACAVGNLEAVKRLIDNGGDFNAHCQFNIEDDSFENFTPLHFAAKYEKVEIINYLLEKGADVESLDSLGRSALHLACMGYENSNDFLNFIYLDNLLECESIEAVELLVKHKKLINMKDNFERTPLGYVFEYHLYESFDNCYDIEQSIAFNEDIIEKSRRRQKKKLETLLNNGADISVIDNNGDSILHIAIFNLMPTRCPYYYTDTYFDDDLIVEMVDLLLKRGAKVDVKNNRPITPLQLAVSLLSRDIVKILLEYGAEVNDVKFDYNYQDFFYADLRPCSRAVDNLLCILQLLADKGWILTMIDNVAVIKFLVCCGENCTFSEEIIDVKKVVNLLVYGTEAAIKDGYEKMKAVDNNHFLLTMYFVYKLSMKLGDFHTCEMPDCELKYELSLDESKEKFNKEIELLKSTKIFNDVTFYELLKMHPFRVFFHLKKFDYQKMLKDDKFPVTQQWYGAVIDGHITKALTRHYIIKSTVDYFSYFIPVNLPDMCTEMILHCLSNEDLLSSCLAVLTNNVESN